MMTKGEENRGKRGETALVRQSAQSLFFFFLLSPSLPIIHCSIQSHTYTLCMPYDTIKSRWCTDCVVLHGVPIHCWGPNCVLDHLMTHGAFCPCTSAVHVGCMVFIDGVRGYISCVVLLCRSCAHAKLHCEHAPYSSSFPFHAPSHEAKNLL